MSPGKDPLDALLEEVARQTELVRESVEEMYDNAFIETNKSWVLPFLGTLVLAGIGIAYGHRRRRRRLPSQAG
jgi:hypothetical protein